MTCDSDDGDLHPRIGCDQRICGRKSSFLARWFGQGDCLEGENVMAEGVTRDDVIYGFRFFLNRDPESEEVIEHHIKYCPDFARLRSSLMESPGHRALYPWYRYPGAS